MTDDESARLTTLTLMQQYQTLLTEARFDEWIELWADDGVCEFPFAGPERPRLLQGKEQILAYMTDYPSRISIDGVDELRVHPALDPNVVVVEMTIRGRAVETDKTYNQQYVIVAEARDGKLAHYREYWNPLVSAEALS
jgi:ketosteroid isomerase-like protein